VSVVWLFVFSRRRRHTRFSRDWSSDVCSSDLENVKVPWEKIVVMDEDLLPRHLDVLADDHGIGLVEAPGQRTVELIACVALERQIGRASGTEREKSGLETETVEVQ